MPRSVRIQSPGAHDHAMCRDNNREEICFRDDGITLPVNISDQYKLHRTPKRVLSP